MAHISFAGAKYSLGPEESVLECLERAEYEIPFSCRNGVCLTCMMRVREGEPPRASQKDLREGQRQQGYFLPCVCHPEDDLDIESPSDAELYGRGVVTDVTQLSANICRLRLKAATPLFYHAGQFINLRRGDGLVRSYSLASVPRLEDTLELHIKRLGRGRMSNWIHDDLKVGEALDIQGPNGDCYYIGDQPERPLLLIGNGSGLAPLFGIARDALAAGHMGQIYLYHGSRMADGLYYMDEMRSLAQENDNFHYVPCLSGEDAAVREAAGARDGRAEAVALADHTGLADWRVYLCGYPPMVKSAKKLAFLAGAALADILADSFELQDLRREPRE
ncbi:MAG: 2Fe-2S iron-sulfur cluster binding domain-containing protein [Rhodospirillaceae bacterium]|jgi:NAD(P)H-flavin reductase/ferredoxin|nr:2Fe-2S iron-sulfur cluster binding domain-containing protein [Rhodospirillaceae bacterium]MBT4489979.1 2Fe-2S iron-sulfur cluster binding domain-containing protein [Rhodospirillaceae bacterium]MBT5193523.1 2Fe-2S iron-sulfur cluster binding domain-containing protein [Rhodospirillaceae bacterium]MBT5897116.1 2Fe-2S iron-sulfur cluster binding domain-containing protein [Rhodospirillaceae bacterium]MBT6428265.1 2Fe-2S iron-sulfur cluster binding domain-containing protein [Rhodospirillaceae bact